MTMNGRYCAIFLTFAAFANVANPEERSMALREKKGQLNNAGNLKIRMVRATSSKLFIEALCDPSCEDIQWETMLYRYYPEFSTVSSDNVEDHGNGQYALINLHPNVDYIVQARIPGSFDRTRGRTCQVNLERVTGLHSPTSGPGWLDIRWTPISQFKCPQDIKYITRHKVDGGNFTQPQVYGFYPIDDKGSIRVGPSHPCDDWPKRFCLLITEGVVSGKNHTVEIVPQRIGADESSDVGFPIEIVVFADPHNRQGAPDDGVHPDCQMWAWLAVGASLFCVAVIIGILISALVTTYEKNQRLREEALNEENEVSGENEETEETVLSAGTTETRQSRELSEN
ncbi:hypothetical protein R5R35_001596 [Gryllus longicercus]|uniref:Uncharacterized protein n=1 Tax=Gryllus longicercus TaxID=2509291 RepID=A0AAN9ZJG3_9ORTH